MGSTLPRDDALAGRREAVLRRWLGIEIARATVEDLAAVPMSERLVRLEDMYDAAVEVLAAPASPKEPALRDALDALLARQEPFAVVVLDAGLRTPAARAELAHSADGVWAAVDGGEGRTAVLLPGIGPAAAPIVADRLRVQAWTCAGADGLLPATGTAVYPDDGVTASDLLSLAHERVGSEAAGDMDAATVTPIHRAL
ncbi:MAG TPA: hypothetical protein VF752_08755 [Thermoleophilaceae bacterium]